MTSKSEPAAPPPCVACKGLPNPAAMLNFDALDLVVSHHALLHAKLAEIAELRALFGPLMDEADWHMEWCDCVGCVWFKKARAALALNAALTTENGAVHRAVCP